MFANTFRGTQVPNHDIRVDGGLLPARGELGMFCESLSVFESFVALVALERLLLSVRSHVTLQITRRGAIVVALVALVWLFSCVLPHHVNFQFTSLNAGKLAHCTSVRLFARMGPFVLLDLNKLKHNHIDCTYTVSLQCVP